MGPGSSSAMVAPAALGEALRPLRLGGEDAVGRMAESLARYGQLTSLTAFAPTPERLEIADGFYADLRIMQSSAWRRPIRATDGGDG